MLFISRDSKKYLNLTCSPGKLVEIAGERIKEKTKEVLEELIAYFPVTAI
jgi:hypothetical protein